MIILVLALFALLLLPDLPKLLQEGEKGELAIYIIIGTIALVCVLRYAMDKSIFSLLQEAVLFTRDTLRLDYQFWR